MVTMPFYGKCVGGPWEHYMLGNKEKVYWFPNSTDRYVFKNRAWHFRTGKKQPTPTEPEARNAFDAIPYSGSNALSFDQQPSEIQEKMLEDLADFGGKPQHINGPTKQ